MRYRNYKSERGHADVHYDGSRSSALLAMAKGGMLPTRSLLHRSKESETICQRCGMRPETLEHAPHECNEGYFTEDYLRKMLGFAEDQNAALVFTTKRPLEQWEKETRIR